MHASETIKNNENKNEIFVCKTETFGLKIDIPFGARCFSLLVVPNINFIVFIKDGALRASELWYFLM